jgi:outer membrane protein assembly factor BamD
LEELTGTVAPGRDRVLFAEAAQQVRKSSYDTGRLLFNTIITTYPDSPFLPLAKLAIADSFYLEGTTSSLIQAGAAYQDWLTFFPTDPLAERVMLKMAEAEMRQMGLPDRDVSHARKAEQRLKVLLQQFPNTSLRQAVQTRLNEVQENLGMHTMQVGDFYYERNRQIKGGLKGAQSRYREIIEKYPNFSWMSRVLFRTGALYQEEEEPDEAAKYFQRVVRDYPNSEFAEKAKEQLNVIGAEIPAPDPIKIKQQSDPPSVSLTQKLIQEILGTAPVTVDKNGVIINKEGKGGDLIDQALANGGELPSNITPTAPVQRRPPARTFPQSTPTQPSTPAPISSAPAPANTTAPSTSNATDGTKP